MLWEISVLNKLYKTNAFTRIKARAHNGQALYVISTDLKFSTIVTELQPDDIVTSDSQLIAKYKLEESGRHYSLQNLYLYDSIVEIARPIDTGVS